MNKVFAAVTAVGVAAGVLVVLDQTLSMPDVHFSYATDECVRVINYADSQFSCENLPTKFNHVWVQ